MHSMTKFMGGHCDIVMGCVTANDAEVIRKVRAKQIYLGATPSNFDCYLMQRSLYTLEVRKTLETCLCGSWF